MSRRGGPVRAVSRSERNTNEWFAAHLEDLLKKTLRERLRSLWRLGVPEARHVGPMRFRDRAKMVVAAVGLASVAATGGVAVAVTSAQAADLAYGFESADGRLGTVWVNGIPVVCIDPFAADSSQVPSNLTPTYGTAGMSDQNAAGLNMVMSTFARVPDNATGAAVELSAWTLKGVIVSYAQSTGYGGNDARGAAQWFSTRAGGSAGATMAKYDEIMAAVAGIVVASPGDGSGQLTFQVDPTNNYLGTLTVQNLSPASATGTLTLTNGVFTDTGTATIAGVTNGMVLNVKGVPPEDIVDYKISVVGDFTGTGNGWAPQIAVFDNPVQTMAGPGPEAVSNFRLSSEDPTTRSTIFQPIVQTTVAATYIKRGDTFKDTLRFSTAADAAGLNNPWRQRANGTYLEVTAVCTVYGNYSQQPVESDDAPAGSPVAGHFTVTSTAAAGPTIDYVGETSETMPESGFYTAQCAIAADAQTATAQRFIPAGYAYKDRFGQVAETSIVPMELEFSTKLSEAEIGIGETLTDTVTTKLTNGPWLRDANGNRYAIPFSYTGYLTPDDAGKPTQSTNPPTTAEAVLAGKFSAGSPDPVSYEFTAPLRGGWLSLVVCITPEDLPVELVGIVVPGCDDYGVPAETVHVIAPEVTTQAKQLATIHDPINDTAIVDGRVPADTVLEFELFKKIEAGDAKLDENSERTDQLWTQEEIDALGDQAYCAVDNRVTKTERVEVEAGVNDKAEYDSPTVFVDENGVYWWVESLIHVNPETGEETVIHRGECGLPNETTTVDEPKVTTKAVPAVELGNPAHDTAIVSGPIPGESSGIRTELTFEAFEKKGEQPVCTPDNRVANLTDPVLVTKAGEYDSADVVFERVGDYWWVETLTYVTIETGATETIHVGECGLPAETTKVSTTPPPPPAPPAGLASTGFNGTMPFLLAGGLMLAGAAALAAWALQRRRRAEVTEQ